MPLEALANQSSIGLTKQDHEKMYRYLYLTRVTDEVLVKKYSQGQLQELVHSCQGEEAVAVGSGIQLRADDYVLPSLRARAYFYLKGASSREMMAGAYGKATGPAHGKNTSHHMGDMKRGIVCGTGIVAGALPLATGVALGIKMSGRDSVVLVSFGDGASSRGDFHESLNLAAVWKLPVIFVCSNNGWAMGNRTSKEMATDKISPRAAGYGMPGMTVDGNDLMAVYEASGNAIRRARAGQGPTLLECISHRWGGHSARDPQTYRDMKEAEQCQQDCPLARYRDYLLSQNILCHEDMAEVEDAVRKEVDDAVAYAEQSPYPSPETVATNVYA